MPIFTFLLSFLFTFPTGELARLIGAIDHPDGVRKLQKKPIAKMGGLAIYVAFVASLLLGKTINEPIPLLIIFGGGTMMLFGTCDDVFSCSAIAKLAAEFLICLIAVSAAELSIEAHHTIFKIIARAGFVTLLVNAYNLIDGTDGLCATVSLVALLFLSPKVYTAYLLFFAVLGFLPRNIPAKIYLGESGAAFIGFSIAMLILYGGIKVGGIFVAAVPLAEFLATLIRRLTVGENLFSPDRGHLHHRLLDGGLSTHGVALIFAVFAVLFSFGALSA